ncbi:DUF1120 domain-containing protein (plasmid) [Pseudomonas sp. UBT]|uniref:DUF1120 domain-containing protein n=1 Tax=Pseudomonas sp. UBT TaxID=3239198 RepID=UPI003D802D2A
MSKSINPLIAVLLLTGVGQAVAASSTDLSVRGVITPSACTPTLSNGGVIDHGKISSKDLNLTARTIIGNDTLNMTVNCETAITFALQTVDNRASSAGASSSSYGLGFINGDQKLGDYSLVLANPIADSVPVQTIGTYDLSTTWWRERFMDPGLYISIATAGGDLQPLAAKDLVVDLQVQTAINRADGLDLSNEVNIDGSATVELRYL